MCEQQLKYNHSFTRSDTSKAEHEKVSGLITSTERQGVHPYSEPNPSFNKDHKTLIDVNATTLIISYILNMTF